MNGPKLCLKARPTPTQLADRLRPVDGAWPDGLELYLAAADLATPAHLETIAQRLRDTELPQSFALLIEGPVDSLDGADFDVTRHSPADLLVIERLANLAEHIGARAVNIHVISPSPDLSRLTLTCRKRLLEQSLPFLARFVELVRAAGAVPTVENMPPVLRMRRSDFAFTPIGMASEDLRWLVERLPGLEILVDTSHAGLYLNARRQEPDPAHVWSEPLRDYLDALPPEAPESSEDWLDGVTSTAASRSGALTDSTAELVGYMRSLGAALSNAQVSNASGVLGEGLAYAEGDFDLDPSIRWLGQHARHIVTEPLEASNEDAVLMRDALRRMRLALA